LSNGKNNVPFVLGNDLVDLSHPDTLNFHPRFPQRICTLSERNYLNLIPPDSPEYIEKLWMIWSIKESAYKACKQYKPGVTGWWNSFEVILERRQVLCFGDFLLNVKTDMGRGGMSGNIPYIHSLVYSPSLSRHQISSGVTWISPDQNPSDAVREFTTSRLLASGRKDGDKTIEWDKENSGAPVLRINHKVLPGRFSFSHHGRFVSYACCLTAGIPAKK